MRGTKYALVMLFALLTSVCLYRYLMHPRKKVTLNSDEYSRGGTEAQLDWLSAGVRVYFRLHGSFPSATGNLRQNLEAGGVAFSDNGQFAFSPRDYWGNNLLYAVNGSTAELSSAGADLKFGTSDDLIRAVVIDRGTNTMWSIKEAAVLECSLEIRDKRNMLNERKNNY